MLELLNIVRKTVSFYNANPRLKKLTLTLLLVSAVYLTGFVKGCSHEEKNEQTTSGYPVSGNSSRNHSVLTVPAPDGVASKGHSYTGIPLIGRTINRVIFNNPVTSVENKVKSSAKEEINKIKSEDNQRRPQIGVELGLPAGAGLDYEVFGFRNLEAHGGVDYFTKARRVSPGIGIGYNIQNLSRVTHNTYLFINWCPTGPSGVGTAFVGIRINL